MTHKQTKSLFKDGVPGTGMYPKHEFVFVGGRNPYRPIRVKMRRSCTSSQHLRLGSKVRPHKRTQLLERKIIHPLFLRPQDPINVFHGASSRVFLCRWADYFCQNLTQRPSCGWTETSTAKQQREAAEFHQDRLWMEGVGCGL